MKWATWVGVFLLTGTLVLTFFANRAAVAAVNVARAIGIALLRAYTAVQPSGVKYLHDPNGNAIASVEIKNVGNVPARAVA